MIYIFLAAPLSAQLPTAVEGQPIAKPILILLVLLILSLSPFLIMMTTSFVKIAVVFSLIRSALGTQQIPPNQIVTGLALILTVYIMIPVGEQVYDKTREVIHSADTNQPLLSMASTDLFKKAFDEGKEPVRDFLIRHAKRSDRALFLEMAKRLRKGRDTGALSERDFSILIPAFVISELTEAFQIGFVIFLPFLVIDMVVSNILLAMGMFMVSPITISLPFKLLLFVMVDGWHLITKGLVMGYAN